MSRPSAHVAARTRGDRTRYHQVHPVKLAVDWVSRLTFIEYCPPESINGRRDGDHVTSDRVLLRGYARSPGSLADMVRTCRCRSALATRRIIPERSKRTIPCLRPFRAPRSSMASRLEQLNRIAVRIVYLNLFAAWAYLHFISKMQTRLFQVGNTCRQILHLKKHTVPSAGLLLTAIGHRSGPRCPRTAQD